jgi:cytochrome c biogenesis protein CcdA
VLPKYSHPVFIASIGAAFALSFDTISQAILFSIAGTSVAGWTFAVALGLVFTAGLVTTDAANGYTMSRLIARADRRAAVASRVMSLAIALLSLVVAGLALAGLLPWGDRLVAPGLVGGARRRGSGALLGAAFAVCAAPCMGPVLGAILVLAGTTSTAAKGSVLLLAYSLGLAVPFVVAGIAFSHVIGPFRWLRDHYVAIRTASGALLVGIGLLLFFDRIWWLSVGFNRALDTVGLR